MNEIKHSLLTLPHKVNHWLNPHILYCNTSIFSHTASTESPGPSRFDTDSIPVGADVCASSTVSQHKHLFTDLQPVEGMFLKGVAGKIPVVAKGTLHLTFEDDKGQTKPSPFRMLIMFQISK